MTKVEALKELAVSMGCADSVDNVTGTSIVDVLQFMYKNLPGADRLADLVVTSVEGSTSGKTKISVSPSLTSGNSYVYNVSPSIIDDPDYLSDGSGFSAWNGTDDIAAEDGHYVGIYEINSQSKVVKFGQAKAKVNLG